MAKLFIQYFEDSFKENWDLPAMTNYETKQTFKYSDVAREIAKLHILFRELGISEGDKIAILGPNIPEWAFLFFSVITYGAVAVPILENSPEEDLEYVLSHSDSKLLFIDENKWDKYKKEFHLPKMVFSLIDYRCLYHSANCDVQKIINRSLDAYFERFSTGFYKDCVCYKNKGKGDLLMLCYSSGTTGYGKAAMLSAETFTSLLNFTLGLKAQTYNFISYLPLAHVFALGSIFTPLITGSQITFIPSMPSPNELFAALQDVKPNFIVMVPLILEAIYKNHFSPIIKNLVGDKGCENLSEEQCNMLRDGFCKILGGNVDVLFTGGASLDHEVDSFLSKIKIPYVSVYGMTEASIIAASVGESVPFSVGRVIDGVSIKIDSDDERNIPGEIWVKGNNVMMGYYKNKEMTDAVFTKDGWFRTGDMGVMDQFGNLYIKGRCKTMILTSSGQNVFPEAIEMKINKSPYIIESVVVQDGNKIVAWVYPNMKALESARVSDVYAFMESIRMDVNSRLASFEYVSEYKIHPTPFEKTSKKSIKRHLYEITNAH